MASMLSGRLGKQCRERWVNYLDPNIKRDAWTDEENNILFEAQRHLGNRSEHFFPFCQNLTIILIPILIRAACISSYFCL